MCARRFGYNTRTGQFDLFLSMSHTLFFKAGVHLKAVLTLLMTWLFYQYLVHFSSNAKLIPLLKTYAKNSKADYTIEYVFQFWKIYFCTV